MFARSFRRTHRVPLGLALLLALFLPGLLTAQAQQPPQPPEPPVPETEPARPAGYGDPTAGVKAVELQRFATMVKGDTAVLERVLGDDLTYTHSTGAVDTKASFLASLQSGKLRYLALKPDGVEARVYAGAAAVVTGRIEMRVVSDGKEVTFPARFTSVYAKRHGRWLLVAWQSTRLPQP
ncbi:MAG TPA: nuclear transport factor 2 family protein [Thermoanaerobaculia bacterium]|nr:nuclear transport factor 2 family protein [Thermoanaerobaculia bacterium]